MQLPDIIALANLFASRAFPLSSGAATGLRRSLRGSRAVGGARSPYKGQAAESGQEIASNRAAWPLSLAHFFDSSDTIAVTWLPQIHGLALISCVATRPSRR